MKEKHNCLIGIRSAEDIKKAIGCAVKRKEEITFSAKGRDAATGMPMTVEVSSNEINGALKPLLSQLTAAAKAVFERTSPQLVTDITSSELLLTGGSAAMSGMDRLFAKALGLNVRVAAHPELCVAKGAAVALTKMKTMDQYGYRFMTKEDVRIR